jgi:hypothetical protein
MEFKKSLVTFELVNSLHVSAQCKRKGCRLFSSGFGQIILMHEILIVEFQVIDFK